MPFSTDTLKLSVYVEANDDDELEEQEEADAAAAKGQISAIAISELNKTADHAAWVRTLPSSLQVLEMDYDALQAVGPALLADPPVFRRNWRLKLQQRFSNWPKNEVTAPLREIYDLVDGDRGYLERKFGYHDAGIMRAVFSKLFRL
ncbi:hypothetical protein AMAG_15228 [Allomyces macrogynus ATCC 38327]|uniref:Uncharacterized protein n=1 Tax=Allomyces macrogynus (strain ATCC 38327) TaxID=578462 RepID=A0A0L0T8E8_ALLM3|nr:hypothetical protein AMAG_15228 [Allomyces macrogynus ATCC 38327]|eukprot:KNE70966.1 hypothetical protein AMAG_15228 [Allomyces macrogynus ATCC 38327]